jgi:nucleoside-diphosphate-sugar epimerase
MRFDLLISEMARAVALSEPITVFSPEAWRPFLHVRDAARALALGVTAPAAAGTRRVYNVVGENYQKLGLVELVRRHAPTTPVLIKEGKKDPRDYRADGSRFARELGFEALSTVEDAFLETARAVAEGIFRAPRWPGHSAVPDEPGRLRLAAGEILPRRRRAA